MSLGRLRILAVTLPTVAFAVILWFRNHQRKRRPRVDFSRHKEPSEKFTAEEVDSKSTEVISDSCTSVEIVQLATAAIEEAIAKKTIFEEEVSAVKEPLIDPTSCLLDSEELVKNLDLNITIESNSIVEEVCKESVNLVESMPKKVDMFHSQVIDICTIGSKKIEVDSMDKKSNILTDSTDSVLDKIDSTRIYKISACEEAFSDLEEGEIRSTDISLVDTKQSSEDDSVFERELEDSGFKKDESSLLQEDVDSDLEEGEIRSLDGRSEGAVIEEQDQLTEKLASLELDQMKKESEHKELPSLELEQMKLDEGKSGSERDSANHSPSEVMLASPSISNFSDAHSEGSSDSGKGQSESAVSPPHTPAGGSSLAGEQAPSVYEFVLPQVIVGRLIGRHGTFLHEIKTQTHTNIFIKRHPDSNKLKICAIEGTQQDIDKALAKIRHKFPLRRFPQLTLEKVSFVQLDSLPPLKPEDFHLHLVEGINNDVVLSSLISAAHFFLQQPCHPSYGSLIALNNMMCQLYSSGDAPILESPVNYAVCAAPAMGGWYRAQIVHVEEDNVTCTVKYLDYGGYSRVLSSDLRQIRGDLLALPFQAVECYLANVAPPPGEEDWSEEARLFVQSLTCGQVLQAQVYDYAEDGVPLVYLYASQCNQVVLINEELVAHGFGVIADCGGSTCGTASEDGNKTDEECTRTDEGSRKGSSSKAST